MVIISVFRTNLCEAVQTVSKTSIRGPPLRFGDATCCRDRGSSGTHCAGRGHRDASKPRTEEALVGCEEGSVLRNQAKLGHKKSKTGDNNVLL